MYCPSCGTPVVINTTKCPKCETEIEQELFSFEPEKTEKDIKKQDVKNNKKIAFLAYLGPFVLVSYLKAKESPFLKFHTNQGLLTLIMLVISILVFFVPNIGTVTGYICVLVSLSFSVLGIMNVLKEEETQLPIIGKYKILK